MESITHPVRIRKKPRRLPVLTCLLLNFVLLCCVGSVLAGFLGYNLPTYADRIYGPPAPQLDRIQLTRLSAQLLWNGDDLITPVDPMGEPRSFQVFLGETPPSIANRLVQSGLIRNPDTFLTYLRYSGLDRTLQAGEYTLSPAMTAVEIAHSLQDPTPQEVPFNILKGLRAEEIAALLPTSGLNISAEEFLRVVHNPPSRISIREYLPPGASLEGFLFPGSYRLDRDITPEDLAITLVDSFKANLTPEIMEGFERQGLSTFEAVTLASIIEREAIIEDEMPLIASVFFNRLEINMKLEADSTAQYSLGYNPSQSTWWTNPLSYLDLQIDSPYNTYLVPGLPPGPIANPGIMALRAVAFPDRSPYYYFRAACDDPRLHVFAETFEEHVANACP